MKKFIIAASMIAVALTSNAQDSNKFTAGSNNLELGAAPFSGAPLTLPYLKYRRFLSESLAFRVGVSVYGTSKSDITTVASNKAGSTSMIDLTTKTSSFAWSLAPGIEKHFAGTEKLSPYVGAELMLTGKSAKVAAEAQGADDKIETNTTKNDSKGGSFTFGLNLLAGADYYFAKSLYLGAEFGWGFGYTSYSDKTVESTVSGFKAPDPVKQGSEMGFGPTLGGLNGKFKLGFLF